MAYAAIVSLKQTMQRLLHSSETTSLVPDLKVELIHDDLCYLQSLLETTSSLQSTVSADDRERRIRDTAHKAEDLIESHVSDLSEKAGDESLTSAFFVFSRELLKLGQEIRSIIATLEKEQECSTVEQDPSSKSLAADSVLSRNDSFPNNKVAVVVGLDNERNQLKRSLFSESSKRQVISIIGMAGIGKTTLAKEVFCDPSVQHHFPCRSFVKVGPKYQLAETLLSILAQIDSGNDERHKNMNDRDLRGYLRVVLFFRKYLIVLDDVWDTQVWKQIAACIPDDDNGSRIILTTRLVYVARDASSLYGSLLKIPFLNDDESWELLRDSVFTAQESCDPQLEIMGKKIAKMCEGLPLAILAVGSLLRNVEKTVEEWKSVAEDENSLISSISDKLYLSYKELPQHLKARFLFMGVFPQGYDISISKLIQLWVAEGLLEPKRSGSLAETAEKCLDDLVSRSLVLLGDSSSRGRTKTWRIHFVFRNLCVREAQAEKFCHVINKLRNSFPEGTSTQRRLCVHNNNVLGLKQVQSSMKSVSAVRSLLFFGAQQQHGLQVYLNYRQLKVLDALKLRFYMFPDEVVKLVQLTYLAITYDGELPASVSRLWNLAVLILCRYQRIKWSDDPMYLPLEIWNLRALRHLECIGFDLPDPSSAAKRNDDGGDNSSLTLEKLLTLSGVSAHSCTQGILARMPNLMKLGIQIESRHDGVQIFSFSGDYSSLHRLESLKLIIVHPYPESEGVFSGLTFPDNLRKITLSGCGVSWEYMTYIGRLPNLEMLKLRCYAFRGPEWVTSEGEFPKLKFLLLEDLDLEQWDVDSDEHFLSLKRVVIRHCYKLKDIPDEFIYITTLETIEVDDCGLSMVNSVQKVQQIVGNRHFCIQIHSSWDDKTRQT